MGLTRKVDQKIHDVDLDKFFESDRDKWIAAARKAFNYLRDSWGPDAVIRRDDVAEALEVVLNAHEELKEFFAEERLTQKYWFGHFADFVVDRGWDEIREEKETEDGDDAEDGKD